MKRVLIVCAACFSHAILVAWALDRSVHRALKGFFEQRLGT